ncbi:MAG TPA: sigma 54-interacting transcriptional regulator [Clostridia bacterium]|nr:sigma 54-interacting transcriptional regulator [Clostridia bacterium]
MENKIGILALNEKLKNDVRRLFPKEYKSGKIMIEVVDPENFIQQGKILEKQGADILISRGGIYRYLERELKIPMIRMKVNAMDILMALKEAETFNKQIVIIFWDKDKIYRDFKKWGDMVPIEVVIEDTDEYYEVKETILKYKGKEDEVVFIGGGITNKTCKEFGFKSVYINASEDSIIEVIEDAKYFIKSLRNEKYKNEILTNTLDTVNDAVLGINTEGKIIQYNKRAEDLLNKKIEDVLNKKFDEIFPKLKFINTVLESKKNIKSKVYNLGEIIITAQSTLVKIDDDIVGVLCTFQDITKLQKLEKNIRFEINKKGLVAKYNFNMFSTESLAIKDIIEKAKKISDTDYTVLLYGESGTGKEVFAQSIHNKSKRKEYPFVAVNCAALTESLLESELFGYEGGAFTGARKGGKAGLFEIAHGGTIFLDEINSMSAKLQSKLLRVIEEKEIMRIGSDYIIPLDVRIIAAANEKLKPIVEEGGFRADLFYRLNEFEIRIPPLRKRKEDIVSLFNIFIREESQTVSLIDKKSKEANMLIKYDWPGNVRELRNVAKRYIFFNTLDIDRDKKRMFDDKDRPEGFGDLDLKKIISYVEKKVIEMMLEEGMNKSEVANKLGISRTSLWNKLQE